MGWTSKSLALFALVCLASSAALAVESGSPAPDSVAGGKWFNSPPLSIRQLRGKVVLVNVWVFSCVNCHNSLPTLRSWNAKYKDQGLQIVGVHTPEFDSDKPADSVEASLRRDGLTWPVFQDNARATWNAYEADAWPSFYLVDRRGVVRRVYAGEISSRYPQAIPGLEQTIRALLAEPTEQG